MYEGSNFSTFSPTFIFCFGGLDFFFWWLSQWVRSGIWLWFWFVFLQWLMMWASFYMLAICNLYIFFRKMSIQVLYPFSNWVVPFCCGVVRVLCVLWLLDPYQIYDFKMFSSILWVVSPLSWQCSLTHKSFKFWWNPIYGFFFFCCFFVFLVLYLKTSCQIQGHENLSVFF